MKSSPITTMRRDDAATIFSRGERAAAALDQVQIVVGFVGAVDGDVERRKLVEIVDA